MKAIIVGHGPSMLMEEMGEHIDSFDTVIRLKRCQNTLEQPEFYGTRTDIVCGSLTIAGGLREIDAPEYWIFTDSRHGGDDRTEKVNILGRLFQGRSVYCNPELCETWDEMYRQARDMVPEEDWDPQMRPSKYDEGKGEGHLSAGLHALIYACESGRFDEVHLIGFDNVMTGEFSWSVTRGEDWKAYPRHRWDVENAMVNSLTAAFPDVKVGFVMPDPPQQEEVCQSNS